jgi:hypothetical protein
MMYSYNYSPQLPPVMYSLRAHKRFICEWDCFFFCEVQAEWRGEKKLSIEHREWSNVRAGYGHFKISQFYVSPLKILRWLSIVELLLGHRQNPMMLYRKLFTNLTYRENNAAKAPECFFLLTFLRLFFQYFFLHTLYFFFFYIFVSFISSIPYFFLNLYLFCPRSLSYILSSLFSLHQICNSVF